MNHSKTEPAWDEHVARLQPERLRWRRMAIGCAVIATICLLAWFGAQRIPDLFWHRAEAPSDSLLRFSYTCDRVGHACGLGAFAFALLSIRYLVRMQRVAARQRTSL